MGRVRKSSCPGESRLDCKGKALGRVMEEETCMVSTAPSFSRVLVIHTSILCSEMSALCPRKPPGVPTDSLCLPGGNAEVVQCFQIHRGYQGSLAENGTSQMKLLMLGPK